ncbi:MAG: response regulator [Deltaproteobacteria bacterium]|jgi:CheY-like chemotaxis protein|nr:response regulator [Deltaproteobacteria bacterium]
MKKILLIDDDKLFLDELSELLGSGGYDVTALSVSKEAVAVVVEYEPDLILLDLKMEELNGFQIAIELNANDDTRSIPIIGMTGYFTGVGDQRVVKGSGIKDCLIKPLNPDEVLKTIRSVLGE